jgi:ribosomal protein S18 acetylase RimI-like enzyme
VIHSDDEQLDAQDDTSVGGRRATVAHVNGSVVRTASGASRSWRMRQWPNDGTVAHLIFVDHQAVPTPEAVEVAIEHARQRGARAIRTSALFPRSAAIVIGAGFEPIDRLALLTLDLDGALLADLEPVTRRLRPLQPWMHRRAAIVDRSAFGPTWGNDTASLRDIRHATPSHHARIVRDRRSIAGFAVSGAAGDNGYLQRVAVSPEYRRRGIARDLVIDALSWMGRSGHARCLVNTGVDNVGALALYEGLGFRRLDDVLTIAERRL